MKEILSEFGFTPSVQSVPNRATMLEYVRRGLGVCVNLTWAKECTSEDFGYIRIEHTHPVSLAWKKVNTSETIDQVIDEIASVF